MQLVYDCQQMDVVDSGMISVAVFGLIAWSAMAALVWGRAKENAARSSVEPAAFAVVVGILAAVFFGGFLVFAATETARWRNDYSQHQYDVLQGCVTGFNETVQQDHDLGVDTFEPQGHQFTLSDSGWRLGYHVSHHHGSPIENGAYLRVFANGPRLLRIELLDRRCSNDQATAQAIYCPRAERAGKNRFPVRFRRRSMPGC